MGFYSGGYGWHGGGGGGADLQSRMRFGVELLGERDGSNKVFTTPEKFVVNTLCVHINGVRKREASDCDYTVSESGGPGTGYDTVTFIAVAPWADENVIADFIVPST